MVQHLTQISPSGELAVDAELDARDLRCPMPLLKAKQVIHTMLAGQLLRVYATDPGSVRDFHSWAKQSGHVLVSATEAGNLFVYVLKKEGFKN